MESPAVSTTMRAPQPARLPAAGTVLKATYRLDVVLGRGAYGVVYRAFHLGLDEPVAIKFIRPSVLWEPRHRKRFEREVRVAKTLKHPNTVRIFDCAETDEGVPYYVMELVEGVALSNVIDREGGLGFARTRRILVQILKALGEAHDKGVVHRDLKPENVLLCDFHGDRDVVKLLDFGVAAIHGAHERITTSNGVVGTPTYMSPEQALGIAVDARSDLYSLGLIGAECLTGQPVVLAARLVEMLATHASPLQLELPPQLAASPLNHILRKATRKEPFERYQSASEMVEALQMVGWLSDDTLRDLDVDPDSAEYELWTGSTTPLSTDSIDAVVQARPSFALGDTADFDGAADLDGTSRPSALSFTDEHPYHRSSVETSLDHEPPRSSLEASPAPWIALLVALAVALAIFFALRANADVGTPAEANQTAVERPACAGELGAP